MSEYGKIINGKLTLGIPSTYRCSDGKTVSNYNLQDTSVWLKDGFLPIEKTFPKLSANKEYSGSFVTKEEVGKIILTYELRDIVEQVDSLQDQINDLKDRLDIAGF